MHMRFIWCAQIQPSANKDLRQTNCLVFCNMLYKNLDSKVHGGQHGAHLGPVGPRWAPCWPHEPCYQGSNYVMVSESAQLLSKYHISSGVVWVCWGCFAIFPHHSRTCMGQGDKTYFNRDRLHGFVMALFAVSTGKHPTSPAWKKKVAVLQMTNSYSFLKNKSKEFCFTSYLIFGYDLYLV